MLEILVGCVDIVGVLVGCVEIVGILRDRYVSNFCRTYVKRLVTPPHSCNPISDVKRYSAIDPPHPIFASAGWVPTGPHSSPMGPKGSQGSLGALGASQGGEHLRGANTTPSQSRREGIRGG